jgi:hypothetical protein
MILSGTVGLAAGAMADPVTPTKVQTLRILPQPADDHDAQPAWSAKSNGLHVLTVRPRLPGEQRDASGRELSATQGQGNPSPDADTHVIRTMPVRPEPGGHHDAPGREWPGTQGVVNGASDPHRVRTMTIKPEPGVTSDPNSQFVPATPERSQAAPR